ncbi:MAG: hypothetical protein V8Q79_04155 [Christensenellales bacterium]
MFEAKLTTTQKNEIFERAIFEGESDAALAEAYGVSRKTIWRITHDKKRIERKRSTVETMRDLDSDAHRRAGRESSSQTDRADEHGGIRKSAAHQPKRGAGYPRQGRRAQEERRERRDQRHAYGRVETNLPKER